MTRNDTSKLNQPIYEEACDWFLEFRSGDADAAARQRFDKWLRASPQHMRAYFEIAAIWNEGAALDPLKRIDIDTLLARSVDDGRVVVLGGETTSPRYAGAELRPPRRNRRPAVFAAASIAGLLIAGALGWLYTHYTPVYSTSIGEQRSFALSDGSTVTLNSRSRIRIRFNDEQRMVELLKGQALFSVAKDTRRPFRVVSDDAKVQAIGTEFDVYRKKSGTRVTVVEGRVAVSLSGQEAAPVLSAGEQVILAPAETVRPVRANVAAATSWTQRRLMFESASLAEVVEEFNRYNTRQIVIEEGGLATQPISGVFSSADPSSLIRFLRARAGFDIQESGTEIRIGREK